jgi:hypothetical protein
MGEICSTHEDRNANKVLVGKLEGKRSPRRHKGEVAPVIN